MGKRWHAAVSLGLMLSMFGAWAPASAQSRLEGTVTATKMTACGFKPGTCEGTLTLETREGGKAAPVTVKVPKGISIKRGTDDLFLPGLKGQAVAITDVEEKGEKVAKSIEAKTGKP